MTRPPRDLSLMLVTDAAGAFVETVLAAVEGGVTIVQLRDKEADDATLTEAARALKHRLAPLGVPLIVNDRVAVARAAGADGVHLGQSDGDPAIAREILGPEPLIGLSVTAPDQTDTVDPAVVDYVGLGPVFPTATKPDAAAPLGLDGFRTTRGSIDLPVIAIGGIDAANANSVIRAGADGLAVVSAICGAPDPRAAALALRQAIRDGRGR